MQNNFFESQRNRPGKMLRQFRSSAKRGRGASATELIILLVLIALVCIGVFRLFGETIKAKLTGAQAEVAAVGGDDPRFEGNFAATSPVAGGGASATNTRGATAAGSATTGGGAVEGSSSAKKPSTALAEVEGKSGSVGGFNPWILVIFLGLGGLLVYVFFAKKGG